MRVKDGDHHFNYYLCGGLAGALASIPTTPFDVIKTKLNTQACLSRTCSKQAICDILNEATYPKKQSKLKLGFPSQFNEQPSMKHSICHEKTVEVKYRNILDTTKKVYLEEGVKGFFTGLKFRMAIQSVSSAIAWGTYQVLKTVLIG